jgi:hypothetical protein
MKQRLLLVFFVLLGVTSARAQAPAPEIKVDASVDFLKLPPDLHFGEVAGVAVNSKGHVFVFSRGTTTGPAYGATAAQLLEFGPTGRFIREIGKNLYAWSYAHVVRIDKDDNIWAVDKGSDMVVKFNPAGRVSMVFGRKKEASDEAAPWTRVTPPRPAVDGLFRQPTDVTWDTAGNIFISDGYINSRVAKFDKNGAWVKQWGERGNKPGDSARRTALLPTRREIYTSRIAGTAAFRCLRPRRNVYSRDDDRFAVRSGDASGSRQHALARRGCGTERSALGDLHNAGAQSGVVLFGCISGQIV